MLTLEYVKAVREAYAGKEADWANPCYSPLFADLRGMPPALVQVGTNEILRSDSERLVEALQNAGGYARWKYMKNAGMCSSRCRSIAPKWQWNRPGGSYSGCCEVRQIKEESYGTSMV